MGNGRFAEKKGAKGGEKAQKMKEAIANYRELENLIQEMREITQNLIMNSPEAIGERRRPKRPKTPLS